MRLGTFNVENMFSRAKALNLTSWDEGKPVLEDYGRLNTLIQEAVYTDDIKSEILKIMKRHKGLDTQGQSKYLCLRDTRGKFLYRPKGKPIEISASGRNDWIGWFELEREPVKETATENTARIIDLLNVDILCVVEAEDRIGLARFNEDVISKVGGSPFAHVMLIDGNDDRGIDVGLMSRQEFEIVSMRSHVDDRDAKGFIFSRDCAEYELRTPQGNRLILLLNHFKSKGYGSPAQSEAKRLRQATKVRQIYDERIADGYKYVAVVGDLNEIPTEPPMDPLLRQGSDLTDIMTHEKFKKDEWPGTHGTGTKSGKFDYILMSPKLSAAVKDGGINRQGIWAGKNGTRFEHLDTIKGEKDAASDHAALWAEADI